MLRDPEYNTTKNQRFLPWLVRRLSVKFYENRLSSFRLTNKLIKLTNVDENMTSLAELINREAEGKRCSVARSVGARIHKSNEYDA